MIKAYVLGKSMETDLKTSLDMRVTLHAEHEVMAFHYGLPNILS
jgi:hypothetical protein